MNKCCPFELQTHSHFITYITATMPSKVNKKPKECIVLICDLFQKTSPVPLGFSFGDFHHALSCQWLTGKKNVAYAAALIFIIMHGRMPRRCRNGSSCLCNQLLWGFIHTYNRILWIKRTLVNIQQHFHIRNKVTVLLRWNYPSFSFPRLNFVFFRTWRTVSWEMLSI